MPNVHQSRKAGPHSYSYDTGVSEFCERQMMRPRRIDCIRKAGSEAKRPPVTEDMLQNKKIAGLQQELVEVRAMLNMLLVLVDPEDVRAAYGLKSITPSHDALSEFADKCKAPEYLRDVDEERPW